jgi:hypothetical protein
MQPAAESRFDCAEHISQRSLGVAMNPGLGGSVFPKVNCGQGYSFQGRSPNISTVSYRSVGLGYGIATARTKVARRAEPGWRAAVLDEGASRHVFRLRATEEGSG